VFAVAATGGLEFAWPERRGRSLKFAITTATDSGYLPAACCQLKSVSDHLEPGAAEIFLVCCDVSAGDLAAAENFFQSKQVPARIIHAQTIADRIHPINRRWPRAAYLRLYFDEIFDRSYDRLVYFDADTRVKSPLAPLLQADLRGDPAGAVHDFIYYVTGNIRRRRRELGLASDAPYLQSGVMVFDWPGMLDQGLLQTARAFLESHPEACQEAPDQDALNHALEHRWSPLDPRWNLHETYLNFGGRLVPFLEHYTSTKPWSRKRPARWAKAADWYAEQLSATVWSGFIPEQSIGDRVAAAQAGLKFRHAPGIRNTLARVAPGLLTAAGIPAQRSDDAEWPWVPRNRKDVEDMAAALVAEAAGRVALIRPPESVLDGFGTGRPIGL
jgi:lipopolysaccharide biosynthesis glycosyltransferase